MCLAPISKLRIRKIRVESKNTDYAEPDINITGTYLHLNQDFNFIPINKRVASSFSSFAKLVSLIRVLKMFPSFHSC